MYKKFAAVIIDNISALSERMADSYFSDYSVAQFGVQKKENIEDMRVGFVVPLLRVLSDYLRSSKRELLYVYIDERKRYSPHLSAKEVQLAYHTHMIAEDYKIFTSVLGEDAISHKEWMEMHSALVTDDKKSIKILAVGDCLMNEVRVFSNPSYLGKDFSIDFRCLYFSANSSGGLNSEAIMEYIKSHDIDLISLSFFSFEVLPEYARIISHSEKMAVEDIRSFCNGMIYQVKDFLIGLRKQTNKTFLLHNVSGLPLGRWRKRLPILSPLSKNKKIAVDYLNEKLAEIICNIENVILIDELTIAQEKGIRGCAREIAPQRKYRGMFHTSYFGMHLSEIYIREAESYLALKGCKALLIDFDNTLWNGVMADGEVEHYVARQQLLKELKDTGILLIAVSKNTEENIRWDEMQLKKEDFAFLQIHWNPKAESISAAAAALNLGKDSFVFIDDNRHERSLVGGAHPDVVILDADLDETWVSLERLKLYPNTQATEEAKKRTRMYQEQAARNTVLEPGKKSIENLKSLGLWYRFNEAKQQEIDRVVELINRTNQFNLTTVRYSKKEIQDFFSSDSHLILVANLGDKFGDLGLVAAIIVKLKDPMIAEIDSFVMSCRAMGFALERALIYEIVACLKERGVSTVFGKYVPSDRNSPSASLYSDAKFEKLDENYYRVSVMSFETNSVSWLSKA